MAQMRLGEGNEVKDELEQYSSGPPLKPLSVPVRTAANLLGVGTTTTWNLISTGKLSVIRIGRRTLVTMASLEALVATVATPASSPRLEPKLVEGHKDS
jgi:excisionase family DNA binding protein